MQYAKQHKRTWPEDQRKYDKFLATWAGRRLSVIDATDVEQMHHAVKVKSGPYQANRVLEMVKSMFRRAIDQRYWKGTSPAASVKKFGEQSRERFLRPDEMAAFFKALANCLPDQQDFFLLLLMTGQRRGAVQAMRWADLDLQEAIWTVPAEFSKNKRARNPAAGAESGGDSQQPPERFRIRVPGPWQNRAPRGTQARLAGAGQGRRPGRPAIARPAPHAGLVAGIGRRVDHDHR